MKIDLSEAEIHRYARHILLPEVGGTGQMALKRARVLVVGAGGLGSPVLLYLAASGVGTIGIVDHDTVDLSNLQRQVVYSTADLGQPKVGSAAARLAALNPEIRLEPHQTALTADNAAALVEHYDIVCDGSDNFTTRFAVADGCQQTRRTLVSAAVLRFDAQISVIKPHAGPDLPCYRCLFPEAPEEADTSCAQTGILGAVTGVAGTLQATCCLNEILGIGESMAGKLLLWNALSMRFRLITVPRDPLCPWHERDAATLR